ncbi:DMT family transporter [Sulfobacillus harzensis]|uniref:DMT family transporter n=1 Tax=Sulfobacillus harzensis TaxID=2729629 RepID=A0A7Y0L501_9FIRM|nr:DMT family transporter [Sulfobacillus harzensis]NMP21969.1 DMT family transporter [Sulfobacillus harzensis]
MPKSDDPSQRTPSSAVLQGALAVGVLSVSSAAVLIRLAHTAPAAIAFWRLVLALVLLSPGIWSQRRRVREVSAQTGPIALSGIFLALHFLFWIKSLSLIPVAASTALVSCHPIFVATYERLVKKRRLAPATLAGGTIILGGLALVTGSAHFHVQSLIGMAEALLGALFAAGYLIIGQQVRKTLDTTLYAPAVYLAAAMLLGTFQLTKAHTLGPITLRIGIIYGLLALLPTLGGHTLFNWILKYLPATTVSLAFLGEIAGSAILAWLILGQAPSSWALAGILAISGGLVIVVLGLTPTPGATRPLPPDPTGYPEEG